MIWNGSCRKNGAHSILKMTNAYITLAIFLSFAALFVLNLAASAAGIGVWYALLAPLADKWSAKRRADVIFALRFTPLLGALVFVSAFLLPAYLLYEPYNTNEIITLKLAVPAFISAVGTAFAAFRIGGSWWKTRRLTADWLVGAEAVQVGDVRVPVYRINHSFPLIAVVGVFSPKIFIARQIFDSLDVREFRAALAHECGHLVARDNFKRVLLGICRDLLVFPFTRKLDDQWAKIAESAADEYAVRRGDAATALDLAAAIVKISRIMPETAQPTMLAGTSMLTEQTGDVTWRVRRLVRLSEVSFFQNSFSQLGFLPRISLFCLPVIGLIIIIHQFLENVYGMLERAVHFLQ